MALGLDEEVQHGHTDAKAVGTGEGRWHWLGDRQSAPSMMFIQDLM